MTAPDPPRVARRLLDLVVSGPEREYVLGDLAEGYRRRARDTNVALARQWYRRQAIRAFPTGVRRLLDDIAHKVQTARPLRGGGGDLRWALRALRRRPTYVLASVGTLGLGLGAAAAVLSVADSVWFSPLAFADPDGVVRVFEVDRNPGQTTAGLSEGVGERTSAVSPPLLVDLQRHDWRTFAGFSAISTGSFDWAGETEVRRLSALEVSPNITDLLGIQPIVGRPFSPDPGTREVLLTESFWRSAFGADPDVVGRAILLSEESYRISGVLPSTLKYWGSAHLWTPLHFSEADRSEGMRGARYLSVVARVRPEATSAQARREVDAFVSALGDAHSNNRGWGAAIVDFRSNLVRPYVSVLTLLLGGAAMFLLVATVNVAGLVAARRADEAHDIALRSALGASRWRIARQSLVEAGVVSGAGALLALVLAVWVLAPIRRLAPADIPRLDEAGADVTMLVFLGTAAAAVAAFIALVSHLMARPGNTAVFSRGRASVGNQTRARYALTVVQVSLTTVLLLGGALLIRHVQGLASIDPGFVPDDVMAGPLAVPSRRYPDPSQQFALLRDVIDALERRGLTAAVVTNPPISGSTMRFGYRPGGWEDTQHWAQYHTTSPAYFDVLSIPVVAGRGLTAADDASAPPVVIVNEALARRHFTGDAVGRQITVVGTQRTIVGVVGSTRHFGPDEDPPAELYVPLAQDPWSFAYVMVRAPDGVPPTALREVVAGFDPQIPVDPLTPLSDFVSEWFAPLRFQLLIIGLFGVLGAVLAGVGIYALIAYVVASRTREIGIRVALGAEQQAVFGRVVLSGLRLTGAGVLIGMTVALALQKVIQGLVAGVDATDPIAYLAVALGMPLIAALACAVPARRAAAVDPVVALRAE